MIKQCTHKGQDSFGSTHCANKAWNGSGFCLSHYERSPQYHNRQVLSRHAKTMYELLKTLPEGRELVATINSQLKEV